MWGHIKGDGGDTWGTSGGTGTHWGHGNVLGDTAWGRGTRWGHGNVGGHSVGCRDMLGTWGHIWGDVGGHSGDIRRDGDKLGDTSMRCEGTWGDERGQSDTLGTSGGMGTHGGEELGDTGTGWGARGQERGRDKDASEDAMGDNLGTHLGSAPRARWLFGGHMRGCGGVVTYGAAPWGT